MTTPTPPVPAAAGPPGGADPAAPKDVDKDAPKDIATLLDEPAAGAWYGRPALWGGVLLVAVVGGGLAYWRVRSTANAAPSYTTQAVARGNLTLLVTANGTIQPTRVLRV